MSRDPALSRNLPGSSLRLVVVDSGGRLWLSALGTLTTSNKAYAVDIAILTIRQDEMDAVFARLKDPGLYDPPGTPRQYIVAEVATYTNATYRVAVTRCVEQGGGEAQSTARTMIEDLSPRLVLVVGIGGAVPNDEYSLGDVVFSTRVLDYSVSAQKSGNVREYAVAGGPVQPEIRSRLANIGFALQFRAPTWNEPDSITKATPAVLWNDDTKFYGSESWRERVRQSLKYKFESVRPPRAFAGAIAASDMLIEDPAIVEQWLTEARQIVAVEMESGGVFRAAEGRVPFVAVRGLSEVVGFKRHSDWTAYACHAAAAAALAFLRTQPIEPLESTEQPSPSVFRPSGTNSTLAPPDVLVCLNRVECKAIRGLEDFTLRLKPPPPDSGQWSVIIGPNGVGKTTFLRALALAMSPDSIAQTVLASLTSSFIRGGFRKGSIAVDGPQPAVQSLALEPSRESGDRVVGRASSQDHTHFIAAYGCHRGSIFGGAARDVDLSPASGIHSLFDEGARLIHAETWLREWQLAALQGGSASTDAKFFNAIIGLLLEILPGISEIRVTRTAVEVDGAVGRVPFSSLSDGYLTTAGWVLDMVARWVERARRRGIVLDENFRETMVGLALVDEIDLHLHPQWQRDIVLSVRAAFPRMSFVVTTHNPLTLLGARAGEVHVFRRHAETGVVTTRQADIPKGADVNAVLTGVWFDLVSTLDHETLQMLEQYRQNLRAGVYDETLEGAIQQRIGHVTGTSIERAAWTLVARQIDSFSPTAETRARVRGQLTALLEEPVRLLEPPHKP